jgi:hypothetical protein
VKGTKPSLPLARYAGTYQDDVNAPVKVTHADGKLTAAFNGLTFDLEHWHYDTFRGTDRKGVLPRSLITFPLGPDGAVAEARVGVFAGDELVLKRKK